MNQSNGDRNLLYGVLALQMGFVSKETLIASMDAWVLDRSKSLAEIMIGQGGLSPQDHPTIELVVLHLLEKHGDAGTSLTAIDFQPLGTVESLFPTLKDPEIQESLALLETRLGTQSDADTGDTVVWTNSDPNGKPGSSDRKRKRSAPTNDRFKILRLHARGGLGEVYLARDKELDRNVALKEIRPEYAPSEKLRERFVREAEINGNLEHPGIVPVYGLGAYPDGRPYYAMRFVEGETLQVALERFHQGASQLDPAQWAIGLRHLLRRFLSICDAIDYAHSRGVLHRDLKPANILLGKFGETLIIDWGLVKIIGRTDSVESSTVDEELRVEVPFEVSDLSSTMAGEMMGSPPFMSPEQARGNHDELLPSSDIYSLGATLYAVLTGSAPITNRKAVEIMKMVARGEIPPPTTVNPRVPKALEAICQKAMRLDPKARYPTARAIADDLECWLEDRPVAIYEDPALTRMLRWSRQHKSFVAASLALLLASVVGLGIITAVVGQQKRQADQARMQAEDARRRANDNLRDGLNVFDQLVTLGDRQLITQTNSQQRTQFLDAASNFIRRVRVGEPGNLSLQIQTAQIARRLANLHRLTGKFDRGDSFYTESLEVIKHVTQLSGDAKYKDLMAETLIDQGDSWLMRGKAKQAEAQFRQAFDIARQNVSLSSSNPAFQRTLARSACRLSSAHVIMRQPDAVDLAQQAFAAVKPLADSALPTVKDEILKGQILPLTDQLELVQARFTLAEALEQAGNASEAEDQLNQALERMDLVQGQFQGIDVREIDFFHAWVGTRLARLISKGPDEKTLSLLEEAIRRLQKLQKQNPELPHFQAALADAHATLAAIHEQEGRFEKAKADADAARTLITPLLTGYPDVPEYSNLMAEVHAILGRQVLRGGPQERPQALALLADAVRYQSAAVTASPENLAFKNRLKHYQALLKIATELK